MNGPDDVRDLVGDEVPTDELELLGRAHGALRKTPPAPEVPESLTARVLAIPEPARGRHRGRALAVLALAAALAAGAFAIGLWVSGDGSGPPEPVEQLTLTATPAAQAEAEMVIDVFPIDDAGNWAMAATARGLPQLPQGAYYEVWLTHGDELAMSCGRFVTDASGEAHDVWLNGPYRFRDYDRWVVVAQLPDEPPSAWLLDGPVVVPA